MRNTTRIHTATTRWFILAASLVALAGLGCSGNNSSTNRADKYGRTYYIDGAGNWGFGVATVSKGLRRAGYQGNIINWRWSATLNPALDQTVGRPAAMLRGKALGKEITGYLRRYPRRPVNIIALSAGTGVAMWAAESLDPPAKLNNLVLLGSSLSSTYDITKALANMTGKVYVYYARSDLILQGPVRALGTIDGKLGVEPTGLVGLHPPQGKERVVNIPWSSRYERYGWTGTHTDATSTPFVRHVLAKHVMDASRSPRSATAVTGKPIRIY